MYPINAASPQRIAVGAVVQISDGAVQTSGVSIKVLPFGTTASAGGGTTGYEEGIVHYTPTQAETNYTSFVLIAYKTGCIPATVTVVTTASAVAGHAGLDWGVMTQKTATNALTNTTVGTATNVTTVNGLAAGVITATSIAADAITDAKVASDVTIASVTGAVGSVTGNVGGNVDGSVNTVTNTVQANVASVTANAYDSGAFDSTVYTAMAEAIWDAAQATYIDDGSFGEAVVQILAKANNIPASPAAVSDIPTAADIADQVWDEVLAGHLTAGTTGNALNAANAPTALQNADALLNRDMSAVSDTNARTPLNALRALRNKVSLAGTALTVTKEDDTTSAWTAVATAAPGADPISAIDPA